MSTPHPEPQWRRVHKITPVVEAWKGLAVFAVLVLWQLGQGGIQLIREFADGSLVWVILVPIVVLFVIVALSLGLSYLAWTKRRFAVTAESVDLHQGILFKQQRHARLVRIQAVDIVQPLIGRIFGMAQVKVESAGGQESNVVISYLKESEAQELRNEILARAAGVVDDEPAAGASDAPDGSGPEGGGGAPAGAPQGQAKPAAGRFAQAAPERELLRVPPGRLVGSLLLSPSLIVVSIVIVAFVIFFVILSVRGSDFGGVGAMFSWGWAVIGWAIYLWGRFAGEFGFRAAISPDGIRIHSGLLETRSQTIPPGRVQAVELSQGLLWRLKGWWRVKVNIAGYGLGEAGQQNSARETILLSVGSRGEALTALWLVLPDLGEEEIEALLDASLEGDGDAGGYWHTPRRAIWLDPFTWRRNGLRITGTAMLIRSGRFVRSLVVVPHERTQSLQLTQGPLERRFRIANIVPQSVQGPVTPMARHLDEILAREVIMEQAERARTARHAEGPEEWMKRVGVPGADEFSSDKAAEQLGLPAEADEVPRPGGEIPVPAAGSPEAVHAAAEPSAASGPPAASGPLASGPPAASGPPPGSAPDRPVDRAGDQRFRPPAPPQ